MSKVVLHASTYRRFGWAERVDGRYSKMKNEQKLECCFFFKRLGKRELWGATLKNESQFFRVRRVITGSNCPLHERNLTLNHTRVWEVARKCTIQWQLLVLKESMPCMDIGVWTKCLPNTLSMLGGSRSQDPPAIQKDKRLQQKHLFPLRRSRI